jgi:hypothetical protein
MNMSACKFGITLPYGDARKVAELARSAEEAGWDGIFVGDAIWCQDPLIQLSAAAMLTSRIRLGTLVLAMPLRRPWHLASESLALDHLSQGRLILGLGTGATWMGWQSFPSEERATRARAEMLGEAIEIITRMHQCEQFDYAGKHYQVKLSLMETQHYPPPTLQQPHVPIWIPGVWPRMKSMQRVLNCDGILPQKMDAAGKLSEVTPADVAEIKAYITARRTLRTPFDIVVEGQTAGLSPLEKAAKLAPWLEAGITWWIESTWGVAEDALREVILAGPGQPK